MKVFQDLSIGVSDREYEKFFGELDSSLKDGWHRDRDAEENAILNQSDRCRYYHCDSTNDRAAAMVALYRESESNWYVSNIVPSESGQLSYDQYNFVLNDFCDRFVKPIATNLGIKITLTKPEQTLEDWISKESARKLRVYSSSTNRSTIIGHPSDRDSWLAFVYSVHEKREQLGDDMLFRWLTEEERWPEPWASELVGLYSFALDVLRYPERRRS